MSMPFSTVFIYPAGKYLLLMLFLVLIYKFMMEGTVTKPWSECCLGSTKAKVFAIGLQSRENFQDVSGS